MKKVLFIHDMPLQPYRIHDYNNFADRGYEVTGGYFYDYDRTYDLEFRFTPLPLYSIKIGPFILIKNMNDIDPDKYDAIVFSPNFRVLNFANLYSSHNRDKVVLWGHHKGRTNGNRIIALFREWFYKKFNALVFYETDTRDEYLLKGFDHKKLFVANNTQYVDNTNIRFDMPKYSFIYVGRIQDRKRVDTALLAFAELKKRVYDKNLKFYVVGGGDSSFLKSLVDREQIPDVEFLGAIYDDNKLKEIYSHAYAYVSPGHVGLGVLQSLAFGVPVITCKDMPHAPEVINCNEKNSFQPFFSVKDIADAMELLYKDKELQLNMAKAAFDHYNTYCTVDVMMDGVEDAVKSVIK